jgi:hypothetical protein
MSIVATKKNHPLLPALGWFDQGEEEANKRDHLSRQTTQKRLSELNGLTYEKTSVLGINANTSLRIRLSREGASTHLLTMGTTGSGKTTGLLKIIESTFIAKIQLLSCTQEKLLECVDIEIFPLEWR